MSSNKILIFLSIFSLALSLSQSDIPNFDKYYKPQEFSSFDMFNSGSKYSWYRYKQSEHFFVFWESGFGTDPNGSSVPSNLRVDVDDLLVKAEMFYNTNINKIKMATTGSGKSYLDKYKLEIYLLYSTEWVATGSGYDNVIGALWVTPMTCQPVGSVIGHEIGHTFQYQVYCDQILQGLTNEWDFKSGYRYGYEGSNGGNGFWEQTAQWQSFIDYPNEIFGCWEFDAEWIPNQHRHFENEYMRYGSYWLHFYWASKHGLDAIGKIWQNSKYPEDGIATYTRIFNNDNYATTREELFDYALRMATYDIDGIREYSTYSQGKYTTKFYTSTDGFYQIAYGKCPGATGFNVIELNVPSSNKEISVEFIGLKPGASLASSDPGNYYNSIDNGYAGTVKKYNNVNKNNVGWRYGFVAHLYDDSRVYSNAYGDSQSTVSFVVPDNTQRLYFVVQGSPETYIHSAWDDKETTDAQFPYKVKFTNTDLKSN